MSDFVKSQPSHYAQSNKRHAYGGPRRKWRGRFRAVLMPSARVVRFHLGQDAKCLSYFSRYAARCPRRGLHGLYQRRELLAFGQPSHFEYRSLKAKHQTSRRQGLHEATTLMFSLSRCQRFRRRHQRLPSHQMTGRRSLVSPFIEISDISLWDRRYSRRCSNPSSDIFPVPSYSLLGFLGFHRGFPTSQLHHASEAAEALNEG